MESELLLYLSKAFISQFPLTENYDTITLQLTQRNYLSNMRQAVIVPYFPLDTSYPYLLTTLLKII